MMIGKWMFGEFQGQAAEVVEESAGRADPSHRMQAKSRQISGIAMSLRLIETCKRSSRETHAEHRRPRSRRWRHGVFIQDHRIDLGQAANRLSQGPGGQEPAIHHAARIEHGELDIALKAIVLQAVIGQDDIACGMTLKQGPSRRRAVAPHEYRTSAIARKHQGLVADAGRIVARIDLKRSLGITAKAKRDDARESSTLPQ